MSKYLLQKSTEDPFYWVLTDTENQAVCKFKEGEFNDTQKFTLLNDVDAERISELPRIANEMAEWLHDNHFELIFMSPQQVVEGTRENIGRQIRMAREDNGYSLRELAKLTGLSHNHIARIESGKYNVNLDTLAIIAEALDLAVFLAIPDFDED